MAVAVGAGAGANPIAAACSMLHVAHASAAPPAAGNYYSNKRWCCGESRGADALADALLLSAIVHLHPDRPLPGPAHHLQAAQACKLRGPSTSMRQHPAALPPPAPCLPMLAAAAARYRPPALQATWTTLTSACGPLRSWQVGGRAQGCSARVSAAWQDTGRLLICAALLPCCPADLKWGVIAL